MFKYLALLISIVSLLSVHTAEAVTDHTATKWEYRLNTMVGKNNMDAFVEALKANPDKDVTIYIDSPGGYVSTMERVMEALESHTGTSTCVVGNYDTAASAAGMILLACDVKEVAPYARVLFHLPYMSTTYPGYKIRSYESNRKFVDTLEYYNVDRLLKTLGVYEKFLLGGDVWLSGREVNILFKVIDHRR